MNRRQHGNLIYYTFASLDGYGVLHGIFTRLGGVSPEPWSSLNTASTTGDSREDIIENRRRIFQAVDRPVETIYDVWQVHSSDVVCADKPRPLTQPHIKADAIICDRSDITLMMRFADCVPIFLYDPPSGACAIVHAGWKGTLAKIAARAVRSMQSQFGSVPENLVAGIGPSIGPDHYEVGSDVVDAARQVFGSEIEKLICLHAGRHYFDLWKTNTAVLNEAGVSKIETSGICTACNTTEWYSHRHEKGKTGRFGVVLVPTKKQ